MEPKHKPRLLLIYRIAAIFILAFLIALFLVYMINRKLLLTETIEERSDVAKSALIGAIEVIWNQDSQLTILKDPNLAEAVHQGFRDICGQAGLRYMYFYSVEENGLIRYYVCAAAEDEDDRRANEVYGYGATQKRPLYDSEKRALTGDLGFQLEIVDNEFGYVCTWVTPLVNRSGEVKGLLGADYDMSHIQQIARRTLGIYVFVGFTAFVFTFAIALQLIRLGAVKPINELSRRMQVFTRDKKVDPGTRNTMFDDEITDIEKFFDTMVLETGKYINDIERLTSEKVQQQTQLEVARRIQCGIVPENVLINKHGLNICGYSRPAWEVGGDFYDILELTDGKIALIEGDVSGKGISAALFMMMIKSAIKEKIRTGLDPAAALNEVNDEVCKTNPESMFATVFAGIFDPCTGELVYANAGHNPPLMIAEDIRELEVDPGMAIGLFEDVDIVSAKILLNCGEGILVYTDGITESMDRDDNQFGIGRVMEKLADERKRAEERASAADDKNLAQVLVRSVVSSVAAYSEGLEQFDDITCVMLISFNTPAKEIFLLPKLNEFEKIKKKILSSHDDAKKAKVVIMCCEEMFNNIVMYSGAGRITFSFERDESRFKAVLTDDGKPFDPVSSELPDKDFESLDSGGMGIMLTRQNCRDMKYERADDENVLSLWFD